MVRGAAGLREDSHTELLAEVGGTRAVCSSKTKGIGVLIL